MTSAAACLPPTAPLPSEGAPSELEFGISGFGLPSSAVRLIGDTVFLIRHDWDRTPGEPVDSTFVVPSALEWRAFWSHVERADVRWWRRSYLNETVVDGTGWTLRLVAGSRRLDSQGSNAWPGRRGRMITEEATAEFRMFVAGLDGLFGEPIWPPWSEQSR